MGCLEAKALFTSCFGIPCIGIPIHMGCCSQYATADGDYGDNMIHHGSQYGSMSNVRHGGDVDDSDGNPPDFQDFKIAAALYVSILASLS
jgi:hypothetical protein